MPIPAPMSQASTPVLDQVRMLAALDKSYRTRLIENPAAALAEQGMEAPEGVRINVVEDDFETWTLTLPPFVGRDLEVEAFSADTRWQPACTLCIATTPICTLGTWTSFLGVKAAP